LFWDSNGIPSLMMPAVIPIYISSPILLVAAASVFAIAMFIAAWRTLAIPVFCKFLFALGTALLALAAARPNWIHSHAGDITVMVDLSPSTRGAAWRDRLSLNARIVQILGSTPYHLIAFGEANQALPNVNPLPDIPADRTIFSPPPTDAILLFSDGRFDLPDVAPRTFVVIDPALDQAGDAAVKQLEFRDRRVVATLQNNGSPRSVVWSGAKPDDASPVITSVVRSAVSNGKSVSVTLSSGDLWPENDSLSIVAPPAQKLEKWWVGNRNPGGDWRKVEQLPTSAAEYLNAAVIVLDNVSADDLSTEQLDRLGQYCRDLGGSLVILGGNRAFAAGNYNGTTLEAISPLASSPSTPTTRWMLLIDGSGSMATDSRWQFETTAITRLLSALPPDDPVSIGSFAENLNWWSNGKSARDTAAQPLQFTDPHGPTNLQPALEEITRSATDAIPTQLLLMTDAETQLKDIDTLAQAMVHKKIHLHLLAIGHGDALPALQSLATATGGTVLEQLDSHQWITSAGKLLNSALPDHLSHEIVDVQFTGEMAAIPRCVVSLWNRTWPKTSVAILANAFSVPMAAKWQVGAGQVAAVAYSVETTDAETIAKIVATPPRDSRFTISWSAGSKLHVKIEAVDHGSFLNELQFELDIPSTYPIPQTGPGRYEVEIAAPRESVIATIRKGAQVLERLALAGRYPPEFDWIGNDRANLQALADRTGGKVIEPGSVKPIDFHWSRREIALAPWLASIGAILLAIGMLLSRFLR
jgi:hypothetical protein